MKKLLITTIFLLISTSAYALDCKMIVQTFDNIGTTIDDTANRAKKGDIVDGGCDPEWIPTETVRSKFAVIDVTGVPNAESFQQFTQPMLSDEIESEHHGIKYYKTKATRKHIMMPGLISFVKGKRTQPIQWNALVNKMRVKTDLDIAWYNAKTYAKRYIEYPINKVANVIVPRAYAVTTNTSKICAVGANCTDENYNYIDVWEAATDVDITAAGTDAIEILEVYNDDGDIELDAAGNDTLDIDGATTDATHYRVIRAASGEKHNGTDNGAATINCDADAAFAGECLGLKDTYTQVYDLIIDGDASGVHDDYRKVGIEAANITFHSNIVFERNSDRWCTSVIVTTSQIELYNNIVWGNERFNGDGYGFWIHNAFNSCEMYNNTARDNSRQYFSTGDSGDQCTCINNIAQDNATNHGDYFNSVCDETGSRNNISDNESSGDLASLAIATTDTTGTTTATTASKLVDSGASFVAGQLNAVVKNTTDTTYTYITAIDSGTTLSLASDIFTSSEGYTIYYNYIGEVSFENETSNADLRLKSDDTIAYEKGYDLSGATPAVTDDIEDNSRDVPYDIGASEESITVASANSLELFGATIYGAELY